MVTLVKTLRSRVNAYIIKYIDATFVLEMQRRKRVAIIWLHFQTIYFMITYSFGVIWMHIGSLLTFEFIVFHGLYYECNSIVCIYDSFEFNKHRSFTIEILPVITTLRTMNTDMIYIDHLLDFIRNIFILLLSKISFMIFI